MNAEHLARLNAALAALHAGLMSCQEAADLFGLERAALWRRCARSGFNPREQREARLRKLAAKAMHAQWKLPLSMQPATRQKGRKTERQAQPGKRSILAKLRRGTLTIPKAAKLADVPISGVIGWMKLARIPIPPPYNATRRKKDAPKNDTTPST